MSTRLGSQDSSQPLVAIARGSHVIILVSTWPQVMAIRPLVGLAVNKSTKLKAVAA